MEKRRSNQQLRDLTQLRQLAGDPQEDEDFQEDRKNKEQSVEMTRESQEQLSLISNTLHFKDTQTFNNHSSMRQSSKQNQDLNKPPQSNDQGFEEPEENSEGFRLVSQNFQNKKTIGGSGDAVIQILPEIGDIEEEDQTDIKLEMNQFELQNEAGEMNEINDPNIQQLEGITIAKKQSSKKDKRANQVKEEDQLFSPHLSKLKNEENNNSKDNIEQATYNTNSRKGSMHSSSSLQLENYFVQDKQSRQEEEMKKVVTDISNFKNYFVTFRFLILVEFFFYHVLFMVFLGPLCNPILYYFGKGLPRNLMFWGNNRGFYFQIISYIFITSSIVLYSLYTPKFIYFESEFIFLIIGITYRIFTIASKYATYDPYKIQALKNHVYEPKILSNDFFLRDWAQQADRIIFEETYFALRSFEIDPSWFYLEFIVSPEKETCDRINENSEILKKFHISKDSPYQPESIHTVSPKSEQFYIYGIIRELITQYEKKFLRKKLCSKYTAFLYALIRCIIPDLYKGMQFGLGFLRDATFYEWYISLSISYLTFSFYFVTIWTMLQGVSDLKRKIFFMEQMAFMISPRKLRNIDIDKVLPTINIFRSSNLKAWQLMRQVCHEYGKKYDIRIQACFTIFALLCTASIVILLLEYTQVVKLEKSFRDILLVESIFALILFSRILYYGAKINNMFDVHDSILNQNKGVVVDIYRMRRKYLDPKFKTTNYLYNKALTKLKEEAELLQLNSNCEHLKELVDSYDIHIQELKFDKQQNPFTIGSLTITNGLLESGMLGIASILIAIGGNYFQNNVQDI